MSPCFMSHSLGLLTYDPSKKERRGNFGSILGFSVIPNRSEFLKGLPLDRGHFKFTFIERDRQLNKPEIRLLKLNISLFDHERKR